MVFVFDCDLQQGMVMLQCLLTIPLWRQKYQMMNYSIQEETRESHLSGPVHLRHWAAQGRLPRWTVQGRLHGWSALGQFLHLIGLPGSDYVMLRY